MRLQVYLARCGLGSRRKCETFIANGRVTVNDKTITEAGIKITLADKICFDSVPVRLYPEKIYVALNKPAGFICSDSDPQKRPLALDLLRSSISSRLYNIGRLDYKSSGLIFFTNDGYFCKQISHPSGNIEKEYEVSTKEEIDPLLLKKFIQGLTIDGVTYKAVSTRLISSRKVQIVLCEGKNREIRRVFQNSRLKVNSVHRIRIGSVTIKGISSGKFRHLKQNEINELLDFSLKKDSRIDYCH